MIQVANFLLCFFFLTLSPNFIVCILHPTISHISSEKIVRVGDTIDLQCAVQYPQDYSVIWAKIDRHDPTRTLFISKNAGLSIPDNRYSIRHDDASYTYTLQLSKIREADSGTYQCQVITGATSRVTSDVNVTVQVEPSIVDNSTREIKTLEGATIELGCYATGNPIPQITWRRANGDILPTGSSSYKGSILIIHNITKDDRGTYYCIANNGVGKEAKRNVGVRVEFKPSLSSPLDSYRQAIGYPIDLECFTEGFPDVEVYWSKDNYRINDVSKYEIETNPTSDEMVTSILHIRRIESGDYGNYICSAMNKLGTDKKILYLEQSSEPVYPHSYLSLTYASGTSNSPLLLLTAILIGISLFW